MNIIKPSSPMRAGPYEGANLETECLYGEKLEILDNYKEWYFVKLLTDNYCGWVKKMDLGVLGPPTHRVLSKRTFVFKSEEVKAGHIHYVPLGGVLSVKKIWGNWTEVYLPKNCFQKVGYIPTNHIVPVEKKIYDWVSMAEMLIGTPYVWGGRDTLGLDCSALLQLSYQTYGKNIPRNTEDQVLIKKKLVGGLNNLKRGHVVFWNGHVGIMADNKYCIHANAYHMQTSKESLHDICNRMGTDNKIVKIMNFN